MSVVPLTIPTGRKNAMASIRYYLQNNLQASAGGYTIQFEQYENTEVYPSISFEDLGVPQMGGHSFDDYMGVMNDTNGNQVQVYGKIAQTNVEFNLQTDIEDSDAAIEQLYNMADQLEYMWMYSGRMDANNNQILPRIALLNFDAGNVDTGATVWSPMEKDSIFIPQYVGTEATRPGIRRLRVLVRVYWHLLRLS